MQGQRAVDGRHNPDSFTLGNAISTGHDVRTSQVPHSPMMEDLNCSMRWVETLHCILKLQPRTVVKRLVSNASRRRTDNIVQGLCQPGLARYGTPTVVERYKFSKEEKDLLIQSWKRLVEIRKVPFASTPPNHWKACIRGFRPGPDNETPSIHFVDSLQQSSVSSQFPLHYRATRFSTNLRHQDDASIRHRTDRRYHMLGLHISQKHIP